MLLSLIRKTYTLDAAAEILGVPGPKGPQQRRHTATRLRFLGYSDPCSRCNGSGASTTNPVNGTRCFECAGSGAVLRKLTKKMLREASQRIEQGALEPYFRRSALMKAARKKSDALWDQWLQSRIAQDYTAQQNPPAGMSDKERREYFDAFFASPLFRLNKRCGFVCEQGSALSVEIADLDFNRDGPRIDQLLGELEGLVGLVDKMDEEYKRSLTNPEPLKPVFASFRYKDVSYFVRVSAATDEHKQMAREYLSKVLPHRYYEHMIFEEWVKDAKAFFDLCSPKKQENPQEALTTYIAQLTENEEVIKDAIGD